MTRVPPTASPVRTARRKNVSLAFTGALLVILLATGVAQAAAVTVGYRDFAYDPGQASRATADTQQSKLWFAGTLWYGGFYSSADNSFNIWRLDAGDPHLGRYAHHGRHARPDPRGLPVRQRDQQALRRLDEEPVHLDDQRLQRRRPGLPVHATSPATRLATRFTLDAGFPSTIFGGALQRRSAVGRWRRDRDHRQGRDATSTWPGRDGRPATPPRPRRRSPSRPSRPPTVWSAPVRDQRGRGRPEQRLGPRLVRHQRRHLLHRRARGRLRHGPVPRPHRRRSRRHVAGARDGRPPARRTTRRASRPTRPATSTSPTRPTPASERRHRSACSSAPPAGPGPDAASRTSTPPTPAHRSPSTPRSTAGVGIVFVIMNPTDDVDGNIYYKSAPLTGAGALTFTLPGRGTRLIDSATDNDIEDATTTKQVLTQSSGLVVSATDKTSKFYLHNLLALSTTRPTSPARPARSSSTPARHRPSSRPRRPSCPRRTRTPSSTCATATPLTARRARPRARPRS